MRLVRGQDREITWADAEVGKSMEAYLLLHPDRGNLHEAFSTLSDLRGYSGKGITEACLGSFTFTISSEASAAILAFVWFRVCRILQ